MRDFFIEKLDEKNMQNVALLQSEFFLKSSKEKIENDLKNDVIKYFVLSFEEKFLGYFEIKMIAPEIELYEIAITSQNQGKGYSKKLMEFLIDFAKANDCSTIFLEVNTINTKAISLYQKFGFKNYSLRKNYYGDNDAILMKLEF